jgi:hypothetical protein
MFSGRLLEKTGITFISTGMRYPILDAITVKKLENRDKLDYAKVFKKSFDAFDHKKAMWNKAAENELSLYQFLKQNIHKDL